MNKLLLKLLDFALKSIIKYCDLFDQGPTIWFMLQCVPFTVFILMILPILWISALGIIFNDKVLRLNVIKNKDNADLVRSIRKSFETLYGEGEDC